MYLEGQQVVPKRAGEAACQSCLLSLHFDLLVPPEQQVPQSLRLVSFVCSHQPQLICTSLQAWVLSDCVPILLIIESMASTEEVLLLQVQFCLAPARIHSVQGQQQENKEIIN